MRFQLRLATWTVTGALQQVILFGLGSLSAVAMALLVLLVIGSLTLRGLLPRFERDLDRRWEAVAQPLSSFPQRHPTMPLNATAGRIETLGAELGILLSPAPYAHRPRPSREAAAELESVSGTLIDHHILGSWELDPFYAAWRELHRSTIRAIADLILSDEAPMWAFDVNRLPEGPGTNLDGQIVLQRILGTEVWIAAADGDHRSAQRLLDAMWRLGMPMFSCPQPEALAAGNDILYLQLALIRRLEVDGARWRPRLEALRPTDAVLEGYMCGTWEVRRRAETLLADRNPLLGFVAQPFARALAIPHTEVMLYAVSELPRRAALSFEADEFGAELDGRLPRWNTVARRALPRSWWSWPSGIRASLHIDLTIRVLDVREMLRLEGPSAVGRLAPSQPSPIEGLSWLYDVAEGSVTIAIDQEPFASRGGPVLRATVRQGAG
jgi:hypothetical protein